CGSERLALRRRAQRLARLVAALAHPGAERVEVARPLAAQRLATLVAQLPRLAVEVVAPRLLRAGRLGAADDAALLVDPDGERHPPGRLAERPDVALARDRRAEPLGEGGEVDAPAVHPERNAGVAAAEALGLRLPADLLRLDEQALGLERLATGPEDGRHDG